MRILLLLLISISLQSSCQQLSKNTKPVLHYLIREPKQRTPETPVLILLHGVGSNEKDLFSLAPLLPDNFLIISARAPFTLGEDSYGWYHLDLSTGKPIYSINEADKSGKIIQEFVTQIKTKYNLQKSKIFLGGFSQGGIMSYSVGLTDPESYSGIIILSGRLLNEIKPQIDNSEKLKSLKIFISHGTYDNVIPVLGARESKSYLESIGLSPYYKEYPVQHTISQDMLADLLKWLKEKSN